MRKSIVRAVVFVCTVILLMTGCAQTDGQTVKEISPGQTGSEVWETMPAPTCGELETEKLQVLDWNSGRLEATGSGRWAETENGYYLNAGGTLYYADKTDRTVWVPVCSKPNCGHGMSAACNAYGVYTFVIQNDRIYFDANLSTFSDVKSAGGQGAGIYSKALNGEDTRLEYVIEEALLSGGGKVTSRLTSEHWLYCATKFNTDGSSSSTIYCLTDSGLQILFHQDDVEEDCLTLFQTEIRGNRCYLSTLVGDSPSNLVCFENGEFVQWEGAEYLEDACYLAGSVLRLFRQNDGYYDVDLETQTEHFVAEAQLENSTASILLPNCIVETTVGSAEHPEGAEHAMKLYDGTAWRDVEIPAELADVLVDTELKADGVASDCIFLSQGNGGQVNIYCISLTQENLVLEYCGTVGHAYDV